MKMERVYEITDTKGRKNPVMSRAMIQLMQKAGDCVIVEFTKGNQDHDKNLCSIDRWTEQF